jgi:polygalacturonase
MPSFRLHWIALATLALAIAEYPIAIAQAAAKKKTVSAADFGAKGDGQQDDAPAIQKALDSGAVVVKIPPGTYRIGSTLWIGSNTTLKADSKAIMRLADGAGVNSDVFLLANRNPGNGNANIAVEGGVWDGNNRHNRRGKPDDQHAYSGVPLSFINVKSLALKNLTVRNPEAYSVRLGEVEDFLVEDITLDNPLIRPNQDGIHLGGYCRHGVIRRIKGVTPNTPNDDMVAINADDNVELGGNLGLRRGPISDILVEDLEGRNAHNFVRILSIKYPVENVTVRRVKGTCRYYAVNMNSWRFPAGTGDIRNIRLETFNVAKTDKFGSLIDIALNVQNLHIRDFVRIEDPKGAESATLNLRNGRDNTIRGEDGQSRKVQDFSIPSGSIKEQWINPSKIAK